MLKLTKRKRNFLTRLADKLYRDNVEDERKAAVSYRRMAWILRGEGFYTQAEALESIAESEDLHKEILNEIIQDIREQVIVSQFKKETTVKGERRSPFKRR